MENVDFVYNLILANLVMHQFLMLDYELVKSKMFLDFVKSGKERISY